MSEFYSLKARSLQGEEISFDRYAGKVVLVVNTASKCGLTPQYEGLQKLYQQYKDQGLVILGFPCNQFANQEPGDAESIKNNCLINYGVSFPMFEKVDVNGPTAHPVYQWLTKKLPGLFGKKVKWNFTKFLIGRDGKPLKRFSPTTVPAKIESAIVSALGK
jgi:glutathione peroxidase